jgi:NADH:ubiquinone oxidoreductase subunit D
VTARASTLAIDERLSDAYYHDMNIPVEISLGEQGDALDRFVVRAKEYVTSVNIIRACLHKLSHLSSSQSKAPSKISLKD